MDAGPLSALTLTLRPRLSGCQHDFGHLSVFGTSKWNHLVHHFVIGSPEGQWDGEELSERARGRGDTRLSYSHPTFL